MMSMKSSRNRWPWVLVFCVALLPALAGCAAKEKDARQLRAENARKDVQAITQPARGPASQAAIGAAKTAKVQAAQAPAVDFSKPITLDEAIAYALDNNLEALTAAQEKKVQDEIVAGSVMRLLPSLIVDAERSFKDRNVPSFSRSARTGQQSLEPSISSEQLSGTNNVTLSWDLLNLTINIFRWRQGDNRADIAQRRLQRIKQNVALEVTQAYMRASVARELERKAGSLIKKAEERQQVLGKMMSGDLISKNEWLQSRIDMKEIMIRMRAYSDEYNAAKAKLAEQMGLPREKFEIAGYDFSRMPAVEAVDLEQQEQLALNQRPDLYERDLDEKITAKEAMISLTQAFPTLTPYARYTYDYNFFLKQNSWYTTGIRLTWDLLSLPRYLTDANAARKRMEFDRTRRMQLTMAVITQVHLAAVEYHDAAGKLPLAAEVAKEREQLLDLVERQVRDGRFKESVIIDEDQKYLSALQRQLATHADLVIAQARLRNTVGQDWGQAAPAAPAPAQVSAPQPPAKPGPAAEPAASKAKAAPATAEASPGKTPASYRP